MKADGSAGVEFARALRRNQTDAERRLWRALRSRGLIGLKFRRQHPVGPYVLDFFCEGLMLAVEVDGGQHWESPGQRHDGKRDAFLEAHGIRTLRFTNLEVLQNMEGVLSRIAEIAGSGPLTPALSRGERELPLTPTLSRGERE